MITSIEVEIERFKDEFLNYGIKFIEKNSTLEGMMDSFEKDINFLYRENILPIIYHLLSQSEKAKEFLENEKKKRCEIYQDFANNFLKIIDKD